MYRSHPLPDGPLVTGMLCMGDISAHLFTRAHRSHLGCHKAWEGSSSPAPYYEAGLLLIWGDQCMMAHIVAETKCIREAPVPESMF